MRLPLVYTLLLISISFTLAESIYADSYRCGRQLVSTGDSSGDLVRICGKPKFKDRGTERVRLDGVTKKTRVERWYYRKNSRSRERVVMIHSGRIVAIEIGSR